LKQFVVFTPVMQRHKLIAVLLTVVALALRLSFTHHPFWIDEFSSANQALLMIRHGFGVLQLEDAYFEYQNITTHLIIALSFLVFGASEWSARIPIILLGSLVPIATYLLTFRVVEKKTIALIAAIFATTSYFLITWSNQARGYPIQQLMTLLLFYFYLPIRKRQHNNWKQYILPGIFAFLGVLTHTSFLIVTTIILADYSYQHRRNKTVIISMIIIAASIGLLLGILGIGLAIQQTLTAGALWANNLWYYHSFLWREHTLISFLGVIGLIVSFFKYEKSRLLIFFATAYFSFFLFIYKPFTSRYLLVIFPFLYLGAGISIYYFARAIAKEAWVSTTAFAICLSIIANGNTFVTSPKKYYSVNHDFREIALINYDEIYNIMKEKIDESNNEIVVIDTWWDRTRWYLGVDYRPLYALRWENENDLINGLPKSTPYILDKNEDKIIYKSDGIVLVSNLGDLKKTVKKYPKGFIFIDDASLPADVIKHAQENFHEELYLDHYPPDDNPHSIWPSTLYSWGFN